MNRQKAFLIILLFLCHTIVASGLTLVDHGFSNSLIVIDSNASRSVKYAADKIQEYIGKISGCTLSIVELNNESLSSFNGNLIIVGENCLTEELNLSTSGFGVDGYHIFNRDNYLVILGLDSPDFYWEYEYSPASGGTLYGAYRFLEELGVRRYYPGNSGEIVPQITSISISNLDIQSSPYFPYRFAEALDFNQVEWFRSIGYGGDRDPWASGHTFTHTYDWYSAYASSHPEYFCHNDKSQIYDHIAFPHAGVMSQIVTDATNYFNSSRPEGRKKYFSIIPNDYFMTMCSCALCQSKVDADRPIEGHFSDYVGEAVVQAANSLSASYPNNFLVYGAYEKYLLPPETETVSTLPPNVVTMIAQKRRVKVESEDRTDIIDQWKAIDPAGIYFWRYYTFGEQTIPTLMPHYIADDIKMMKQLNEEGGSQIYGEYHFRRCSDNNLYWFAINEYVTGKLLWNPDLDVNEILDDYYQNYYGPAALEMKQFFTKLENKYYEDPEAKIYGADFITELEGHINTAKVLATGTNFLANVEFVETGFEPLVDMREILVSDVSPYPLPDRSSDLVLYYDFDDVYSSTIYDQSFSGLDGDVYGDIEAVDGNLGDGFLFDGIDDYIEVGIPLSNTDYTVMAWIKSFTDFHQGDYYIIGPSAYHRFEFKIVESRLHLNHRDSSGNYHTVASSYDFLPNQWYHVAGSFSQTKGMCLYIDGDLVAYENSHTIPSAWSPNLLGATGSNVVNNEILGITDNFRGIIDELKVYDVRLMSNEIRNISQECIYPIGDLNKDCIVNIEDLAILSAHWLEDARP